MPVPRTVRRTVPRRTAVARTALVGALALGAVAGVAMRAPEPVTAAPVVTSVGRTTGHVAASRTVTIRGEHLDAVTAVRLGRVRLAGLHHISGTRLTVVVPHAPGFEPGRASFSIVAGDERVRTGSTFRWVVQGAVDRELRYLGEHLHRRGGGDYPYYPREDCANFVSQVLHARGLPTTAAWHAGTADWANATHLRTYLLQQRGVEELTDTQAHRALVRIGDVVEFDWDRTGHGDRDHAGVVTRIDTAADGRITVFYSAHTDENADRSANDPAQDRTIEEREAAHRIALRLHVTGKAYFLHFD